MSATQQMGWAGVLMLMASCTADLTHTTEAGAYGTDFHGFTSGLEYDGLVTEPPDVDSNTLAAMSNGTIRGKIRRNLFSGYVRGWACDTRSPTETVRVRLTSFDANDNQLQVRVVRTQADTTLQGSSACTPRKFEAELGSIPCNGAVRAQVIDDIGGGGRTFLEKRSMSCRPKGKLESISADGKAAGWACDLNNPNHAVRINAKVGGQWFGADANRDSEFAIKVACSGGDHHRFRMNIGRALYCNETMEVFAIDDARVAGRNRKLGEVTGGCGGGSDGPLEVPIAPFNISSPFGYRTHPVTGEVRLHRGVDIGAASGTPVYSASGGTVVGAGYESGAGNFVNINHGGVLTKYFHLSRRDVSYGQRVNKGQRIGLVGSTGMSTGPHLHFETWVSGSPQNPLNHVH